jgi:hypothetical protein
VTARRVYHFVDREFGLADLRQRRLKIATIEDLNDPFELRGMALTDPQKRWAIGEWRRDLSARIGMLCFSTSWRNPVQWSHYAKKHTGLCLGFDVPDNFLIPVQYQSKLHPDLVTAALGKSEEGESAVLKLLGTKYSHWRYEREVRMFLDLKSEIRESDLYFHAFEDGISLKEVIVGSQSTVSRADLKEALSDQYSGITAIKARLAFRSFNVVRQREASLWK